MIDRTPTEVLENGAIRYAVYDEQGNFLRYEYILPADEPTQEGTPLNKATLLSDEVASALGGVNTPSEAFAALMEQVDYVRVHGSNSFQILMGGYLL